MKKKILSLLLCFALCFSLLPMGAFADELPDELLTTETPAEVIPEEELPAEVIPEEKLPAEEILEEELPAEVILEEELPAEVILEEELPAEEILEEELPAEVIPEEELPAEEILEEELPAEEILEEEPETISYTVSVEDCDGGKLVFSATEYAPRETVTFTVEAEEGYILFLLEFDPETEYAENEDGSFSFIMPETDVTVSAVFDMPMLLGNLMGNEPVPYRYYDKASGQFLTGTCDNYISISENLTEWGTGWYVVDRDVSVGQVTIPGDGYGVNLILKDNCTLTVTGGIYVEYIQSLTIYAQSDGDDAGRLTSQGAEWCDAIGGGGTLTGGSITIDGGIITAEGNGNKRSGIAGKMVIINGGTVRATGGNGSPAIKNATINGGSVTAIGGAGGAGFDDTVTINGGTVEARGGNSGAGIGGNVTINGGTVEAHGGSRSAGIGSSFGKVFDNWSIDIYGGEITASGGTEAAGIGMGSKANNGNGINIHGGTIIAVGGDNAMGIGFGAQGGTPSVMIYDGNITSLGIGGIGGQVTIKGGVIHANGSTHGAGISGTVVIDDGTVTVNGGISGSTVVINGGTVTATGYQRQAGIFGEKTTINGGTVIATGGDNSPGICHGTYWSDFVEINGGTITATGGTDAAGIGVGKIVGDGFRVTVKINGGTVTATAGTLSAPWQAVIKSRAIGNGCFYSTPSSAPEVTIDVSKNIWLRDNNTGAYITKGDTESWSDVLKADAVSFTAVSSVVDYREYNAAAGGYDTKTCTGATPIGSGSDIALSTGWYAAYKDAVLDSVSVQGDVHLILMDGCTMTVKHGLHVNEGNSLTIYDQPDAGNGKGTLNSSIASGDKRNYRAAGIGSNRDKNCGNITIHGGTIIAEGGYDAAGIGGGSYGSGGTVTIYGGNITAIGYSSAAGIGGGRDKGCGNITINGGNIVALAQGNGAGIGTGAHGSGGSVTINGGAVTASSTDWGAGIGSGSGGSNVNVSINGGAVTASSTDMGAGIGAGADGWNVDVTITGGTVTATGGVASSIGFGAGICAENLTVCGGIVDAINESGFDAVFAKKVLVSPKAQLYIKVTTENDSELHGSPFAQETDITVRLSKHTRVHFFETSYQHEHNYNQKVVDAKYRKSEATCTEAAVYYKSCICGEASDSETFTSGDPLGHSFPDTWEQYNAEQHKHTCTRCKTEIEYGNHDFDSNICKGCGYVKGSAYIIIAGVNSEWTKGSTTGLSFTSDAPFDKFTGVKVDGSTIAVTNYTAEKGSTKITLAPAYLETLSVGNHSIVVVSSDGTASTNFTVKPAAVPTTYTVTFNMNGHGTQIAAQSVESGSKATKPADPAASGYTFGGWYADATCSSKFDFNSAITANITLYAKWAKTSVAPTDPTIPKTGDNSNMLLWLLLLAASGAALTGTAIYGRKKKKTN